MSSVEEYVRSRLLEMQDKAYKEFACKLMPEVKPETVIGVRTPALRQFARAFAKTPEASAFMKILPHAYYEENNLHGFLIEAIGEYDACIAAVDAFLPWIDNWATCDLVSPKVFQKNLPALYEKIKGWLGSGRTYTVRFGVGMLLRFYLDEHFKPEMLALAAGIQSEEYYINMMTAWYFATALAKQYEATLPYLQEKRLAKWTHNKTIQKAIESYRISSEAKAYLRTLKS